MKPVSRRSVLGTGAAAVALFAIGSQRVRAQEVTRLRFAHTLPESSAFQDGAMRLAEEVKERSNGALEIQIYSNGVLGNDPTIVNAVRGGSLDLCVCGNSYFSSLLPKLSLLDIPFLLQDRAHIDAVFDGPIIEQLREEFLPIGLKSIGNFEIGWRNLTNNVRPIREPADLEGLKIRTQPSPPDIKAWELLGAVPTPMAFSELFTALELGAVDGQENPITLILDAKFYEVQTHLSLTQHSYTSGQAVMNLARFESLTPELQAIMVEAGKQASRLQRQANADRIADSVEKLKEHGMQVVEDIDAAPFREIVAQVKADYAAQYGSDLVDQIAAAAE